ncbi:MAG: SIMPL domain-containing protein [Candidatus Levybacteria bacterium]|nr:SIMPL domain-containing protein [Candidatus Levybacteria bacterium]
MWKEVRTPLITVLFIFIAVIAYTKLLGPIPFTVNSISTVKDSLFTVEGTGEVTAIPDTAMVSMGVSKTAASVETAQTQVNEVINQITTELKNLGIDTKDIKTVNYSVNPNYDYTGGTQRINGYIVNADVQVKIKPVDKANQAIDIATKAGATNVGNVQFVIDDEKRVELEEQARKEAIEKAKAKAESIARTSGIRLGRLVDVQENSQGYQPPVRMQATMEKDAMIGNAVPATELNPGENKVSTSVSLSYETL